MEGHWTATGMERRLLMAQEAVTRAAEATALVSRLLARSCQSLDRSLDLLANSPHPAPGLPPEKTPSPAQDGMQDRLMAESPAR
jgi:hypothetical protein